VHDALDGLSGQTGQCPLDISVDASSLDAVASAVFQPTPKEITKCSNAAIETRPVLLRDPPLAARRSC
jgi:hypothetical protein